MLRAPRARAAAAAALLLALAGGARAPTALHLAVGADPTTAHVQWQTRLYPWPASQGDVLGSGASVVQYGTTRTRRYVSAWAQAVGRNWTFVDPLSPTNRSYTFHTATMTGLTPGAEYHYRVGTPLDGWSAVHSFRAARAYGTTSSGNPLRLLIFGDAGWTNFQSLSYLQDEVLSGDFDAALNLGDYAYDLPNMDGVFGDEFQAATQPITSQLLSNGAVGNHEGAGNFGQFLNRYAVHAASGSSGLTPAGYPGLTPGLPNSFWYSYDLDLVHVVVLSTEAYWIQSDGGESLAALQYAWLDADLAGVNRSATPWLVVVGHRSLYCSCDSDCLFSATWLREGIAVNGSSTRRFGLEALLSRYGVDLWLNGHEHNVERSYPTFNGSLAAFGRGGGAPGGTAADPEVLINPAATIYLVSGAAGNKELHEPFTLAQPPTSAFRSNTYSYGRLTFFNASHALWEAVQTDNGQPATTGRVMDAMLLESDHRVGLGGGGGAGGG